MRRRICHRRIVESVCVRVMRIMHVGVFMCHRLVDVFVLVALAQVQPYAKSHQGGSGNERDGRLLAENDEGRSCAYEWSRREVRTGARSSQLAESENKEDETHSVAEEAQ